MNPSSLDADEDQDSLFGSPPPSPVRGRSPPERTFTLGEDMGDAIPSTGMGAKNVGTIALPGSHMSCAELPANLPASGSSLSRFISRHDSSGSAPPCITGMPTLIHAPVVASRSSTPSASSGAISTARSAPSAIASARKRRAPKAKTPAPHTPPIILPGPNEPTPPNFLRSQSSLLGLAGLVASVKPAQLYAHDRHLSPIQPTRSHSPVRGSTPNNPIVLDDDRDTPHIGKRLCGQQQTPRRLDQLDQGILRSNMINSLVKEKNIFPVLESLIKLLGDEPHPPVNPSSELFVRPYSHGIFNTQTPSPAADVSAPGGPTTLTVPPLKRRKLKHVPAGAADWNIPFPFAVGEGPEAYRDTWAQDRVKRLAIQLLELVQNAAKRAAIKTAKARRKASEGPGGQSRQLSRSMSVETRSEVTSPTWAYYTSPSPESAIAGMPTPVDGSVDHYLRSLEIPSVVDSPMSVGMDGTSVDLQDSGEEAWSEVSHDNTAFEEWLTQLRQFIPLGTNISTPESDWGSRSSVDSLASSPVQDIPVQIQDNASISTQGIQDEAIDPVLLAMSQQADTARQSHSSTSPTPMPALSQVQDISSTLPILPCSLRASSSSLTEPLTPLFEAVPDVSVHIMTHQDFGRDSIDPLHRSVERDDQGLSSTDAEHITAARKGKARADVNVTPMPSMLSRSTASGASTPTLPDKKAVLERARERRKQLVAEIERTKKEIWAATIKNAALVHSMKSGLP